MRRDIAIACQIGLLLACSVASVVGAPFAKKIKYEQPDGTTIELWGEGDEFHAVFESLDGYTVVFNPATKAYDYARLSADQTVLVSTGVQVAKRTPKVPGLTKHLRMGAETVRLRARERYLRWDAGMKVSRRWADLKTQRRALDAAATVGDDDRPLPAPPSSETTGTKVGLCLLIDFDDDPATVPQASIEGFCNGESYSGYGNNGSVRDYFLDNSNNQLSYSNVVTVYIRIPNSLHPKSWYNNTAQDNGTNANYLIRDAIGIMTNLPNYQAEILPAFDALTVDGNNRAVAANVFFAGGNGGVWSYGLWPHSWVLAVVGAQDLSPGGKKVYRYQITDIGSSLELGTFCHENGHMLCGYPDLYDYEYDSMGGAGIFCLMNSGGYGANPVQVCAYLKHASGWATVTELTSASSLTATVDSSSGPGFNHFYRYARPGVSTEYFLMENRQSTGRDDNLPASGVAVWHIDELGDRDNQSLVPNSVHANYECSLIQADNQWHFQNDVNNGDAYDLYHSGNSAGGYVNMFSDTTAPDANWWDGTSSGLTLSNFSASGSSMTFTVVPAPGALGVPILSPFVSPDTDGNYTATWSATLGASRYELHELTPSAYSLSDGAEAGDGNWLMLPRWEISARSKYAGGKSFRCSTVGLGEHFMTLDQEFLVSGSTAISFWVKIYYFASEESVQFQVSDDGGATWADLWEFLGTTMPSDQDWTSISSMDLSPYVGKLVQVRFRHTFEGSSYYDGDEFNSFGVFIDEVVIAGAETLTGSALSSSITDTSYAITGQDNGSYYYKVRGINVADALGEWSNVEGILVDVSTTNRLTVSSAYGVPSPSVGEHLYDTGTAVTCGVAGSPVEIQDATSWRSYACTGWVGSGSVATSGLTTNTGSFFLTEDSTITWSWVVTDLVLSNQTVNVSTNDTVRDTISARDGYTVGPSGDVTLEAGEEVRLGDGFTARSGSVFRARITVP